ncbi:MAG: hypothetical protein MRQ07_02585 [Candidatus Midichloria sp.]|nr:hypothetical protein [Candidatus Midichloria sp.]
MSTSDSWLNTTSALITHDIIKKLVPLTKKQALFIARLSTCLISNIAIFFSLTGKGVKELDWLAGNFWCPLILLPMIAGFLRFRTNPKSFIASVVFA